MCCPCHDQKWLPMNLMISLDMLYLLTLSLLLRPGLCTTMPTFSSHPIPSHLITSWSHGPRCVCVSGLVVESAVVISWLMRGLWISRTVLWVNVTLVHDLLSLFTLSQDPFPALQEGTLSCISCPCIKHLDPEHIIQTSLNASQRWRRYMTWMKINDGD